MDLKQLEYFLHVAELGSFTRASTHLSVVQPALSRQVRQLEEELGQELFARNGRGVVLTEAGRRLLDHTRGILMQVERARADIEEERNADSGHFTLGLPPSLGRSLTVPLVTLFRERLPKARLATVEGLSAYVVEWLAQGRIDCALTYNASPAPALDLLPLLDEQLFLLSARGALGATTRAAPARGRSRGKRDRAPRIAPVRLPEVADYELIIPARPHAMRMAVENALAKAGCKIRVAYEIESIPAIIDLVRQGHGHAVLPMNALLSTAWAAEIAVRPIVQPLLAISLWLATSAQRPRGPLVRKAMGLVSEVVRREIRPAAAPTN
jgi:LysR family nitrogen assimilation transcriptional regulator